jgi:putative membrane protein
VKRRLKESAALFLKGFCMGAADVVPGVSGGTMAFILGIYTRLIDAIKSFDEQFVLAIFKLDIRRALGRPQFSFLIPLSLGIIAAIIFFTHVIPIPKLLHSHPELIYGLFFGLIVGSIIVLLVDVGWRSPTDVLAVFLGLVAGSVIISIVPTETPDSWWFIMGSGALAICAMVVPGISGSFILLILGKYATVLDGIGKLDLTIILPFAVGAAFGLAAFTRLLSWLLHRLERTMVLVISGFLLASLWVIWPFQERHYVTVRAKQRLLESIPIAPPLEFSTLEPLALALIGLAAVIGAARLSKRSRK